MTSSSTSDFRVEIARIVKARPTDRVLSASDLAEAVALVADAAPGDVLTLDLTADLASATASGARRVVPAQIDLSTTLAAVDSENMRGYVLRGISNQHSTSTKLYGNRKA